MMYNELKYGKSVIWYYDIMPEPFVANEMIRLQLGRSPAFLTF